MILGFVVILSLQLVGELLSTTLNLPVPGSVIGMIALLLILIIKSGVPEIIAQPADTLVKYIGLLFVPAGAGISIYLDLIAQQWFVILVASFSSTLLTLLLSGFLFKLLSKHKEDAP